MLTFGWNTNAVYFTVHLNVSRILRLKLMNASGIRCKELTVWNTMLEKHCQIRRISIFKCKCSIFDQYCFLCVFRFIEYYIMKNDLKMPICRDETIYFKPSNCYQIDEINLIGRYSKVQKFIMEFPLHWCETFRVHESAVKYAFEKINKCLSKYLHLKYNHCLHYMNSGPMKLDFFSCFASKLLP